MQTPNEPAIVPASLAQERIWLASQLADDAPVYHVVTRLTLSYRLDREHVRGLLATLVERHEVLRTCFRLVDGELRQVVHRRVELPLTEPASLDDALVHELAVRPFQLDRAPLWRACVVRLEPETLLVVFVAHHAVFDGASELNLRAELIELAAAAEQLRQPRLPRLPMRYADYVVLERDRLATGRMAELLAYWRRTLAGLPTVHQLPTDRPRPRQRAFGGADEQFSLPAGLTSSRTAETFATTPFVVLLACYVALLHRLSGSEDIVVGVPVAGRDLPELQPLIGMFMNMVVLRVGAGGDPTFRTLVLRVRDVAAAAWQHRDMPYQKLVELLAGRRGPGAPPLYQIGFNYLPIGSGDRSRTAEDDLMLEIAGGSGRLEYNTALFEPATARTIAAGYLDVLRSVLATPDARLSVLPVAKLDGAAAVAAKPAAQGFRHPRTGDQQLVAKVWREVLAVDRIGAHDDFFGLGGHSLLALRAIARLGAATGVDLPVQEFFADPTVTGVAGAVARLRR